MSFLYHSTDILLYLTAIFRHTSQMEGRGLSVEVLSIFRFKNHRLLLDFELKRIFLYQDIQILICRQRKIQSSSNFQNNVSYYRSVASQKFISFGCGKFLSIACKLSKTHIDHTEKLMWSNLFKGMMEPIPTLSQIWVILIETIL